MTVPAEWQAPDPDVGPAPGVEFATPGARLVGYIVDILIQGGRSTCWPWVGSG